MNLRFWGIASVLVSSCVFAQPRVQPQFGAPIQAVQDEEAMLIPLQKSNPPRDLAQGAEVILISGYEAKEENRQGAVINVDIDRPKSTVLLVLTSYEKIHWKVNTSPETIVSGIVVSGYYAPTLSTSLKTSAYLVQLPYATETDNVNFKNILTKLDEWFGVSKVDAFRSAYGLPSLIRINALDPARPQLTLAGAAPEKPTADFAFNLITADYKRTQWTLTGPKDSKTILLTNQERIALPASGKELYQHDRHGFKVNDLSSGTPVDVSLPSNFPRFSWTSGVAYDSKRNIVSVVSYGGEGFLYRLDAVKKKWLDVRSLDNVDIYSLAYDASADRYVGWTSEGELIFISGEGHFISKKRVVDRLPDFGRLYDRGNGPTPTVVLAAKGDNVAILYMAGNTVKAIWNYRADTNEARLTYRPARPD